MSLKKIKPYNIYIFLVMFTFFIPHSITLMSAYSNIWIGIYNVTAIIRCGIALSYIGLFIINRVKSNVLVKCIVLYELSIFVACCINGSITFQFTITNCLTYIGLACLLQFEDIKKKEKLLDGLILFFGFFAIMGALSIIFFPNGFNDAAMKKDAIYFLGSKNNGFFYFTMYIYLSVLKNYWKGKGISLYHIWITAVFVICTLLTNSMTGFITIFLSLGYLLLAKYRVFIRKVFTPKFALLMITVAAALIPFVASGKFDWAFNLIGRESNFSMRTFIWASAINLIQQKPLWGNGKDGDIILYGGQTQAHNIYIDYATKYGLITLVIFIIMLIIIAVKMSKNSKKDLVYINAFFFFILFFHSLFDSVTMSFITLLLFYNQNGPAIDYIKTKRRCTLFKFKKTSIDSYRQIGREN